MDPNACLDRAEGALNAADRHEDSDEIEECAGALDDYDTWIRNGGFAPAGGAKRRAELGERFDALRALFPSDDGWGDASRYTDGPE